MVANIYEHLLCQTPYMDNLPEFLQPPSELGTISSIFQMKTIWPRKVKNLTQDHMIGMWGAGNRLVMCFLLPLINYQAQMY